MNQDIVVVGSVAFDDIETIKGRKNRLLGGSGIYFSLASSLFSKTHLIGIVGDDFNQDDFISCNYLCCVCHFVKCDFRAAECCTTVF